MHGEVPPPFDVEEAGLMTKTTQKMIYDNLGHPKTVRANPEHTSSYMYLRGGGDFLTLFHTTKT